MPFPTAPHQPQTTENGEIVSDNGDTGWQQTFAGQPDNGHGTALPPGVPPEQANQRVPSGEEWNQAQQAGVPMNQPAGGVPLNQPTSVPPQNQPGGNVPQSQPSPADTHSTVPVTQGIVDQAGYISVSDRLKDPRLHTTGTPFWRAKDKGWVEFVIKTDEFKSVDKFEDGEKKTDSEGNIEKEDHWFLRCLSTDKGLFRYAKADAEPNERTHAVGDDFTLDASGSKTAMKAVVETLNYFQNLHGQDLDLRDFTFLINVVKPSASGKAPSLQLLSFWRDQAPVMLHESWTDRMKEAPLPR